MFPYRFIVAPILDETSSIFGIIHFCIHSNKGCRKMVELLFETRFAFEFKIDVRQENGILSLKWKNNRNISNDVMIACVHAKIYILLSAFFFFLFYDFGLNKQGYILRQTACLVVNPIIVDGYASLFNCTTAVRASDSMTASS